MTESNKSGRASAAPMKEGHRQGIPPQGAPRPYTPGYDAPRRSEAQPVIPQQRVVEKLDEHMSRNDLAAAERHLLYWLGESVAIGDDRGQLMLRNELVGHFRKTGDAQSAFEHAAAALKLLDELEFGNTISAGTTYTNIATAYNAFGRDAESLELFQRAAAIYEGNASTDPKLLGGLYNNMALTCVSLGRHDEADELYRKALDTMERVENGQLEQAITYLNMADAAVARDLADADGAEEAPSPSAECERQVEQLLDTALGLIDTPGIPHDGYYAFVCEKCAPTFGHYGYFLAEQDLAERAREIYERP